MDTLSVRSRALARHAGLKTERATWDGRYREVTQFLLPFSGRFYAGDHNRGDRSFNSILDSTATRANGILAAGMQAGVTSPARPWHRVTITDSDLAERPNVKLWLNAITELQRTIFSRSNTYRALHSIYEELGGFATGANIIDDNFDTVLWNSPLTVGEYCIATDALGKVNSLFVESEMTVAQIVEEFAMRNHKSGSIDWSNISQTVKNAWDTHKAYDVWVPVLRVIEPRSFADRGYNRADAKNMAFRSCYLELQGNEDKILRESGYKRFPVLAPRWHTRGRDIYGNGPSFVALGDIKQLQHQQLRKGQAIDFLSNPPIGLPAEAKGREVEYLPGGVTYFGAAGAQGSRGSNLLDVKIDLSHLLVDIKDVRDRINSAFYADLFLMLANDQRRQPVTAREIAERHEEKLLMLGPVLERLHDELLSPLIDITFDKMVEAGLLQGALEPPRELQGQDLKVEFVSTLAQAQKAVGLGSLDRLIGTVALMAQGSQDGSVWDKVDKDQLVDKYADMLAVDPTVIVADERVAIVRQERAKQQQAAQAAAAAPAAAQMATAAKTMAETDPEKLRGVMDQFTGYN